jgi:hypothetical protein
MNNNLTILMGMRQKGIAWGKEGVEWRKTIETASETIREERQRAGT